MFQLFDLKARDVMVTDVVQLHALSPITSAIETFEEYSISGAPVVDETGQLVGVLSASDILKRDQAHEEEEEAGITSSAYYAADPLEESDEDLFFSREEYRPQVLGRELVNDWMTPRVISVRPEASLAEVCRLMVEERVHRVFVVERKKLLGVISTFDIVNCLAQQTDGTGGPPPAGGEAERRAAP